MDIAKPEHQKLVPELLLRQLAKQPDAVLKPSKETISGTAMIVDITGFTTLVELLCRKGSEGLEELSTLLNAYFGLIMDVIEKHGGDVIKLAGDALIVIWPETDKTVQGALSASRCALEVQAKCHDYPVPKGPALAVRIGLAHDRIHSFVLGDINSRWEFLARGKAFSWMTKAQKAATPGQIVLHSSIAKQLEPYAALEPLENGFKILRQVHERSSVATTERISHKPAHLERFLSHLARNRPEFSQPEWQAELRRVTVMFIGIPKPPGHDMISDAESIRDWMEVFVYSISRFGGAIKEWRFEESAITPVVVFGLQSLTHEDDPLRAIHVARDLGASLQTFGVDSCIGIASGRAYLGSIGSEKRREYALIGEVLNVAARLSQSGDPGIFCDQATRDACLEKMEFTPCGKVTLKGWPNPVEIFSPTRNAQKAKERKVFVGRIHELQTMLDALQLQMRGQSSLIWIEGEAGIGKSSLVQEWIHHADHRHVRILSGKGESIHQSTPYFPWRTILSGLFRLKEEQSQEAQINRLDAILSCKFRWRPLLPLLSDILRLGLPDNHVTEQMLGKARVFNTTKLVSELVAEFSAVEPLAIVLEDAHWMDSASLEVAAAVSKVDSPLTLILTSRPDRNENGPPNAFSNAQFLQLRPLESESFESLLLSRIDAKSIDPKLSRFIFERSQGIPLYALELLSSLKNSDHLEIRKDRCVLAVGIDLGSLRVPESLQGIITERIDRLESTIQLTAKVASAIGDSFPFELLQKVHPAAVESTRLQEHLSELASLHLIDQHAASPDSPTAFQFCHSVIRDAVYDLILNSQKRQLHSSIANELESLYQDQNDSGTVALLAHHLHRSGQYTRAAKSFAAAAESALREGAYREARDFSSLAIEITQANQNNLSLAGSEPPTTLDIGEWFHLKGEALLGLGELLRSFEAFTQAVDRMQGPSVGSIPTSELWVSCRALLQNENVNSTPPVLATVSKEQARRLALCYENLGILFLFSCLSEQTLQAAYLSVHFARQLESDPVAHRALALLSLACALHKDLALAQAFAAKAQEGIAAQTAIGGRVNEFIALWLMGHGQWEETESLLQNARQTFQEIGNRRFQIECTCLSSTLYHYRGKYRDRVELGKSIYSLGQQSGDVQAQSWGVLDQIESLLTLSKLETVAKIGPPLLDQIDVSIFGGDVIMTCGLLARYYLLQGNLTQALELADRSLQAIAAGNPTIVYLLEAYAATAEVFIEATRRSVKDGVPDNTLLEKSENACQRLEEFASVFPIAQARSCLLQARLKFMSGDFLEGRLLTQKAYQHAGAFKMDYEKTLALEQLADFGEQEEAARETLRQQAHTLRETLAIPNG